MLGHVPPYVRRVLPPLVLGLGALSSAVVAIQLLLMAPDYPLLAASFFGSAILQGVGAVGLWQLRFWARGYGLGAILSSGVGLGIWVGSSSIAIPASLLAVLLLISDEAPGQFERREAFLARKKLDRAAARRLFWVALGLGFGLPALLGTSLSIRLWVSAPLPTAIAAALGVLGFWGLTRLASWCYFAVAGAVVSLVVAVVMSALGGYSTAAEWGGLCAAILAASILPLTGPVWRHLRGARG